MTKLFVKLISVMNTHNTFRILTIVFFTILIYGNTCWNDYAGDDPMLITDNQITLSGFQRITDIFTDDGVMQGWLDSDQSSLEENGFRKRYRPLTQFTFAAEFSVLGLNPHISHLINVLLFAFCATLIFLLFAKFNFGSTTYSWYVSPPFLIALLFVAHPIHTEVVANLKSRDEILALTFALLSVLNVLNYVNYSKIKYLIFSGVFFFLGLLSKENMIVFLAITPLIVYFVSSTKSRIPFMKIMILLAIPILTYLIINQIVLRDNNANWNNTVFNDYFLNSSVNEKFGTIFYSMGKYLQLLIFPHNFICDYSAFQIPILKISSPLAILSLLLHLTLIIYALVGLIRKNIIAFGIAFYLIAISIYSNVLFSTGTAVAERFLFIPSIGYCIVLACFLTIYIPRFFRKKHTRQYLTLIIAIIILVVFSNQSIARNFDWKTTNTLLEADVKKATNSARLNYTYAGLFFKGEIEIGKNSPVKVAISKKYYQKAVGVYPNYWEAWNMLATCHYYQNNHDSALVCYFKSLRINKEQENVYKNISAIANKHNLEFSLKTYLAAYQINEQKPELSFKIGTIYRKLGKKDSAIYYLQKAANNNRFRRAIIELEEINKENQ
jgi:tetratricopeptide (TPR) repeat protein